MRNVFLIMFFAFCYNVWAIDIKRAEFIPSAIAPGEPIEFVLEYRESETFYDVEIDMNTDWRPLYVRSYRYRTMSDGYKMIKILFGTDSLDYRSFSTRPFFSYLIKIFFKTRYSSQRGTYHVQASFGAHIGGHTLSYIEKDQRFVFYSESYSGLPVNTFWLGTFSELGTSIKNGESLSFPLGSKIILKGVHLSRFIRYTRSGNPNNLDYVKLKEEYILEIRTTGPFEMIKDGRKTSIILKDKFPFVVMDKTPYTKLSDSTWNIIIYPRDIGHGYLYVSLKYRQTNEEIFSAFIRLSSFRMGNVNYSWTYQNNQSSGDYVSHEYFLESISVDINSGKIRISGNGSKNESGGRAIIGCYKMPDRPRDCFGAKSHVYTISVQRSSILYDDVDILVTKGQGGFTAYWDDCIRLAHTYNYDGYKYLNYPDC
ncbi:MAG: hypothetical protein RML47_04330, partial [Bacteroidota bacterium]|nr:hypothetical protein [Bacteroidota bacterium]